MNWIRQPAFSMKMVRQRSHLCVVHIHPLMKAILTTVEPLLKDTSEMRIPP